MKGLATGSVRISKKAMNVKKLQKMIKRSERKAGYRKAKTEVESKRFRGIRRTKTPKERSNNKL